MTLKQWRNWGKTLGLFMASAALIGCQSKATTVERKNNSRPAEPVHKVIAPTAHTSMISNWKTEHKEQEIKTPAMSVNSPLLGDVSRHVSMDDYSALVLNTATCAIIYGHNENELRSPASLAKLMLLYLAFKHIKNGDLDLDEVLTVERKDPRDPKHCRLLPITPQDRLTVREIMLGAAIYSANNCADMLAERIGGKIEKFVGQENLEADTLNMEHTKFINASGMPEPEKGKTVTTAVDMARLTYHLKKDYPDLTNEFLGAKEATISLAELKSRKNPKGILIMRTHSLVQGSDMGKTGLSNASGYNIFSSFPCDTGARYDVFEFGFITGESRNKHDLALVKEARKTEKEHSGEPFTVISMETKRDICRQPEPLPLIIPEIKSNFDQWLAPVDYHSYILDANVLKNKNDAKIIVH